MIEKEMQVSVQKFLKILWATLSLLVLIISLWIIFDCFRKTPDQQKLIMNYNSNTNLDYKVYLKPNKFYERSFMEKNKKYISSIIDYIDVDLNYMFNTTALSDTTYSYSVSAVISSDYDLNGVTAELWSKSYQLVAPKSLTKTSSSGFQIKENLKLDYNKLQDMMKNNLTNLNYINIFDKLTLDNYYKTDTHWKQEDLFDVANTIANQMNFDITNNNVVNTVTTFKGSYAGRLSVTKDIDTIKTISNPSTLNSSVYNYETKQYTKIYDYDKLKSLDKYDIYLSGASSIIDIVNPTSNSNRELIVFRDSYGSSLIPLLMEGYKKITVIDIRYVSSRILNNYIIFNNQDVLFMYSILTINNSFSMR